jgi:hypothetical protein
MNQFGHKLGFACLALGVLAMLAFPAWRKFEVLRKGKAHAIGNTYQDLQNISLGVVVVCELEAGKLMNIPAEGVEMSGAQLYTCLAQSAPALDTARPNPVSMARKIICDVWGHGIHAKFQRTTKGIHLILLSDGPNGRNENGHGDDIVFEQDLETQAR